MSLFNFLLDTFFGPTNVESQVGNDTRLTSPFDADSGQGEYDDVTEEDAVEEEEEEEEEEREPDYDRVVGIIAAYECGRYDAGKR